MASALRYYNEFTSEHFQRLIRVEIWERDYTGSSEQIEMGASLHLSDSGDGREEPIKKLTASLRLLSESNFQFEHLFTADDRKYKVKIRRDGTYIFRGFLESDSYSEPYYTDRNYTVNLTARDNLGRLEDIPYLDGLGDRIEGLEEMGTILERVLAKTGLDLVYYDHIGLWSSDMDDTSIMTNQTYLNNDAFWNFDDNEPLNCLEVLTNIMTGLCSQVRQHPNGWTFVNQANYYNRPTVQGVGGVKEFDWINRDAEMAILPAWKEFTITQNTLHIENAFKHFPSSIDDFTKIEDGSGRRTNKYDINDWNMQDVPYVYAHDDGSFTITNTSGVIGSLITPYTEIKESDDDIHFTFNAKTIYPVSRTGSVIDDIRVDVLLITNQTTQDGWILTQDGWEVYTGSQTKELIFENINSADGYKDLTITAEGIPEDGEIAFRIWPNTGSYLGVSNLSIEFLNYSGEYVDELTISAEIDEDNNTSEDGFETTIGQAVEDNGNLILTYAGALLDSIGNAQTDWKRSGDATARNLLECVGMGYYLHNKQQSRQVNGSVMWDYDVWTNIIDQGKHLMINSVDEWNLNTDQMTAEFVEVFEYMEQSPVVFEYGQIAASSNESVSTGTNEYLTYTAGTGTPKRIYELDFATNPIGYNFLMDSSSNSESNAITFANLKDAILQGVDLSDYYNKTESDARFAQINQLHDAVTITGESYASLSGQQITFSDINLASNVTGTLGDGNLSSNVALKIINNNFSETQTGTIFNATIGIQTNGTTRIDASGNFTGGSGTFSDIVTANGESVFQTGSGVVGRERTVIGGYNIDSRPDIEALVSGSNFGGLLQGGESGHMVVGIRGNDSSDSFAVISGGGSYTTNGVYNTMMLHAKALGSVDLYYSGSKKLETTSSGIGVTGNVVASGSGIFTDQLKESGTFTSGFGGNNWLLDPDDDSLSHLTIDRLTVRDRMDIYELVINQIRATNGSLWVSDAVKIETISGTTLSVNDDTDITFQVNDIIKAEQFDGRNVRSYTATVASVGATSFTVSGVVGTGWNGMELVRIGNTTNIDRQGALYLTSSDNNAPYLDVLDGVTSTSYADKTKVRLGKLDGITDAELGTLSGYGLYGDNVFLKGKMLLSSGSSISFADVTNATSEVTTITQNTVTAPFVQGLDCDFTTGTIGAWEINNTSIYSGDYQALDDYTTSGMTIHKDGAIRAKNFRVDADGKMSAIDVDVSGKITATISGLQTTVLDGANIYESSENTDTGVLSINSLGYQSGFTKFRTTLIGNGKGSSMLTCRGVDDEVLLKSSTVTIENTLDVDGSANLKGGTTITGTASATKFNENGTDLVNKYAAKIHTHDYLPTSGGTVSGNLNVTGNLSTNTIDGMKMIHGSFYSTTDGNQSVVLTALTNVRTIIAHMNDGLVNPINVGVPSSGNICTFNRDDAHSNGTIYYVAYGW